MPRSRKKGNPFFFRIELDNLLVYTQQLCNRIIMSFVYFDPQEMMMIMGTKIIIMNVHFLWPSCHVGRENVCRELRSK